jgi:methylated-DNA-[protein]-cysteine S-methyltransferase
MTPTDQHASLVADLRRAFPDTGPELQRRLREALANRADNDGLLDVAYRTLESPVGTLLLAATPRGLVRVAFAVEGHDAVLERLALDISPRIMAVPQRLDETARQLDEYFAGRRRHFELPLDLQLTHGFRRTVIEHLPDIPYGTTASYRAVADASGNPAAVRAAASACSHNPLPVVVPCHRVVRGDGSIGQYLGGSAAKRTLLDLEAAA